MITVAVSGANGRMGQLIVEAVEADPHLKLVAKLIRSNNDSATKAFKELSHPPDVLIDFAPPKAVLEHVAIAAEKKYRMIIGTTGFTEDQKSKIIEGAKKIPIVFSPNMSIVANVSYKLLALAADILKDRSDIAILDIHHKHKKDVPSGTALRIAEVINHPVSISSFRLGDTAGEHTTLFSLEGERLEITHRTSNRTAYAKGAIEAAKWIIDKKPGLYDMQDVLGL